MNTENENLKSFLQLARIQIRELEKELAEKDLEISVLNSRINLSGVRDKEALQSKLDEIQSILDDE